MSVVILFRFFILVFVVAGIFWVLTNWVLPWFRAPNRFRNRKANEQMKRWNDYWKNK